MGGEEKRGRGKGVFPPFSSYFATFSDRKGERGTRKEDNFWRGEEGKKRRKKEAEWAPANSSFRPSYLRGEKYSEGGGKLKFHSPLKRKGKKKSNKGGGGERLHSYPLTFS